MSSLDLRMLAYALSDKKVLLSMVSVVRGEYFHPELRALWELILVCFTKYKEVPTSKILEYTAGLAWEQISDSYNKAAIVISSIDLREYKVDLEKLKKRYNDQLLRKTGQTIYKDNWNGTSFSDMEGANKTLREVISKIDQLYKTESYKEGTLASTAKDAWATYQRIKKEPALASGIHLGFKELDRITNGIREGELLLIGGESGTGKSALAMNMACNAWRGQNIVPLEPSLVPNTFSPGRAVVYFTIEMPYDALERRLHACVAGVPLYGIRDGTLSSEEENRYKAALRFIQKYPYQFHIIDIPRGASMRYIETKYLELCQENPDEPLKLVVVDYMNIMSDEGGEGQDWLKIGHIAEQGHEFTRVHSASMISPVQLNRPAKEESSRMARPDQDRIARSLMLAQNANMIINIEKRRDEHLTKDMRLHIVKMRDGEQTTIVLQKCLDRMRLLDSPTDWSPEVYESKE